MKEAEDNIQKIINVERALRVFPSDLVDEEMKNKITKSIEKAKKLRLYYAKSLGVLDRIKKEKEL
jgi:hypothetical protein